MSSEMTAASLRWAFVRIKTAISTHADELNALDGAIGDGDLGVTLSRFVELAANTPPAGDDIGMLLLGYAKLLTGTVGSTFGTLMATGLMAAAKLTKGRTAVPFSEVSTLLDAACAAMAARGKSGLGDKTVLDALASARTATLNIEDSERLAQAADAAVKATLAEYRGKLFRQGRARIWGERGIGLDDPGMVAFKIMVESLLP